MGPAFPAPEKSAFGGVVALDDKVKLLPYVGMPKINFSLDAPIDSNFSTLYKCTQFKINFFLKFTNK